LNPLITNLSKREIPSLYGLRGVAALAVAVWHYLDSWKLSYFFPGPFAVTLFFELSGLLITWLLLKEIDETGWLDRRQFYLRRALRLFPVFYVVWALCRFAGPFAGSWEYFFYLGDYYTAIRQNYGYMTQAWSLGVEEKFYILWPLILMRVGRTKLIKILVSMLIFEPLYRCVLVSLGYRTCTWFAFDTRLDPIVLGCLIAILAKRGWVAPSWMRHPLTPICALVFVFVFQKVPDIATYLLAVILISVICRPTTFLNNPVARYFGAISYSLYLCHGYARDILWSRIFGHVQFHYVILTVTSQVAIAIALASALHFSVERPFLKLKNRLHKGIFER
jgi:peptidoglycan/LPS O-acetylase OafA/YrhL